MIRNWNKSFAKESTIRYVDSLGRGDAAAHHLLDEFEDRCSQYYGRYAVFMSSGTAALFFSLWLSREHGFNRIVLPDRSWIANLNVPLLLGFDIDFIDIQSNSPVADWDSCASALFTCQSAVSQLIHISGFVCDSPRGAAFCVEDFSQANVRSRGFDSVGMIGDVSVCSLGITKAFSTIHGGSFSLRRYADCTAGKAFCKKWSSK